jgi:hypothetical protein
MQALRSHQLVMNRASTEDRSQIEMLASAKKNGQTRGPMSQAEIRAYLAKIGAKGGKTSRRELTPEQARAMQTKSVAARRKATKAKK